MKYLRILFVLGATIANTFGYAESDRENQFEAASIISALRDYQSQDLSQLDRVWCRDDEESSECTKNYNRRIRQGVFPIVAIPVNFKDQKWGSNGNPVLSVEKVKRSLSTLSRFYRQNSRGKIQINWELINPVEVDLKSTCKNRKAAAKLVGRGSNKFVRLLLFPSKVCGYPGNTSQRTIYLNGPGSSSNGMLMIHEMGHAFGYGHAHALYYKGQKNGFLKKGDGVVPYALMDKSYGDYTSPMGNILSHTLNPPQLHWNNFLDSDEVVLAHLNEPIILRTLDSRKPNPNRYARTLVYILPHSGNRLFLSLRQKGDVLGIRGFFRATDHKTGIALHISSACKGCSRPNSMLVDMFKNTYEDETGLVIQSKPAGTNGDGSLAEITLTQGSAARCNSPIEHKLLSEIVEDPSEPSLGHAKITLQITNPNPPGCRPFPFWEYNRVVQRKSGVSVVFHRGDTPGRKKPSYLVWPGKTENYMYTIKSKNKRVDLWANTGNFGTKKISFDFNKGN